MANIEIYTKSWCPFCARAKALLDAQGLNYREIDVTHDPVKEREMVDRSQRTSVPQIFINGNPLGGSDDLMKAQGTGHLNTLLAVQDKGEAA